MKILYITCNFTYGGVEQYLLNIFDLINKDTYTPHVSIISNNKECEQEIELHKRAIPVHAIRGGIMQKIKILASLLKSQKYDIIHINGFGVSGAIWTMVAKIISSQSKIIVHSHTTRSDCKKNGLLKEVYKWISRMIFSSFSDCKAACSLEAAHFLFGKNAKDVKILNNGINLAQFTTTKVNAAPHSFITIARFSEEKNPFYIVQVIKELKDILPDVKLTWVGSGKLKTEVKSLAERLGLSDIIKFIGVRKDIAHLLTHHRYFILPSLYEGLGITFIEAQAAGCFCFASSGVPELADCGAMLRPSLTLSPSEYAKLIRDTIPCNKLADNRLTKFDIQYTVRELEKLYQQLT